MFSFLDTHLKNLENTFYYIVSAFRGIKASAKGLWHNLKICRHPLKFLTAQPILTQAVACPFFKENTTTTTQPRPKKTV